MRSRPPARTLTALPLLLPRLQHAPTHRGGVRSESRQLAIVLAAAAVTFGIGRFVGVEIA